MTTQKIIELLKAMSIIDGQLMPITGMSRPKEIYDNMDKINDALVATIENNKVNSCTFEYDLSAPFGRVGKFSCSNYEIASTILNYVVVTYKYCPFCGKSLLKVNKTLGR